MTFQGKLNVYRCPACNANTITIDRDEGVTPMFLACRATIDCDGRAVSSMYQVDQSLVATYEWYRPTMKNARRQGPDVLDHVKRGGLMLRKIVTT